MNRGNNSIFDYYSLKENNCTKALINVLEYSNIGVLLGFLDRFLGVKASAISEYNFEYQFTRQIEKCGDDNFILAIAETKDINKTEDTALSSVPDGAVLSNKLNVIIESKVGVGSYLTEGQLNRHRNKFDSSSDVQIICVTWFEVRDYFRSYLTKIRKETHEESVTAFLLEHFEQFCVSYGLGVTEKDNEYWFSNFGKKYEEIARGIDRILIDKLKTHYQKTRNDGIGYHKYPDQSMNGFAKLDSKQKCLILRYGGGHEDAGIKLQKEVYSKFNLLNRRSKSNIDAQPNELWIYLDWLGVDGPLTLSNIEELAQEALRLKYAD